MRFKSILLLMIFLNFMVLPSVVRMFGEDISSVTLTISEEETSSGEASLFSEKMISEDMSLQGFSSLSGYEYISQVFVSDDDAAYLSPFLSVHYTPPEAYVTVISSLFFFKKFYFRDILSILVV